jgi:hypothetical protein
MIPLVELIDDETFNLTVSGNKYGDIYEAMFDFAKGSELNANPIPSYYEKYMTPLI